MVKTFLLSKFRDSKHLVYKMRSGKPAGQIYIVRYVSEQNHYKIGQTTNFKKRLRWLTVERGPCRPVGVWDVSDLNFCEQVALRLTANSAPFSDLHSELRIMDKSQVNWFVTTFDAFIRAIDNNYFKLLTRQVTFVVTEHHTEETTEAEWRSGIELKHWQQLAHMAINEKTQLSRRHVTKRLAISQPRYHKIMKELKERQLVEITKANRTIVTSLGEALFRGVLTNGQIPD